MFKNLPFLVRYIKDQIFSPKMSSSYVQSNDFQVKDYLTLRLEGNDFYDRRVSILSKLCPYCYTSISGDQVQKFIDGKLIQCTNCNVELKVNEK